MSSRALIARWLTVLSVAFSATACGQPRRTPSQPADIYAALRNAVINLDIGQILPEPAVSDLEVRMMLVDIGVAGGTATVMVAADGTVSFYSSSGGGVLGLGEHEHIREAAFALLRMADAHKDLFPPVSSASDALLPGAERVRFTLRLPQGYRSVEAALAELGEAHPLSPLFTAVNGLIVEISETPEAKASIGQGP